MPTNIYHNHHIIPKHAGGTNAPENIVRLTRLEHSQAHYDLWLEHGKSEDYGAAVILARGEIDGLDNSGKNNPFYGKKHTEETKRRIGETSRQRIADGLATHLSDAGKKGGSVKQRFTMSEQGKANIRNARLKTVKKTCHICKNYTSDGGNLARHIKREH